MADRGTQANRRRSTREERDGRSTKDEPDRQDRADSETGDEPAGDVQDTRISAADAASAGLSGVAELTGKKPEGVTSVEPTDDGWRVGVEMLEDERVPSSADILAIYEADLDPGGTLLSYRRTRRYPRSRGDSDGER
jgi:Gas vesicle synthesis protein GvpO